MLVKLCDNIVVDPYQVQSIDNAKEFGTSPHKYQVKIIFKNGESICRVNMSEEDVKRCTAEWMEIINKHCGSLGGRF